MTIISKWAWFVLAPLNLLMMAALVALVLVLMGWRKTGRAVGAVVFITAFVCAFTQMPDLLVAKLEARHKQAQLGAKEPYGIIVLGGGIWRVADPLDPYQLNEAGDRVIAGLALKNRFPRARLIITGVLPSGQAEGEALRTIANNLYPVPPPIEVEGTSRSTRENADRVAEMVGEERARQWFLVTSALHMERALWTFRKRGFLVQPWPVDSRAEPIRFPYLHGSASRQFAKLDAAVKEFIGLAAYRLLD
ncbi:MAG: YdcF family protein [Pseudomonadota bacterium]